MENNVKLVFFFLVDNHNVKLVTNNNYRWNPLDLPVSNQLIKKTISNNKLGFVLTYLA